MKTSNLESKFLSLWDRRHLVGGPEWVAALPNPKREYKFHPVRKWRFDFAWPAYRVAVEVDGGTWSGHKSHTSGAGIDADNEKRNAALDLGWRVFVFTSTDLFREPLRTIQLVANLLHKGKVAGVDEQLSLF